MTYQCRVVLRELKKLTNNSECVISYLGETTCFCLLDDCDTTYDYAKYQHEIDSIISMLADEGYLQFSVNRYNFYLTQKAIHKKQVTFSMVCSYILDKWIDFLALIVATIALIVAIAAYIRPL